MDDRGRQRTRIIGLPVPQLSMSRDRSRDRLRDGSRSRNRNRDQSPYSLDATLSRGYTGGNDVPILEDDETSVDLNPILPVFSTPKSSNAVADGKELDQVPLPEKNDKDLVKEIDDDFQLRFNKDVQSKGRDKIMKRREPSATRRIRKVNHSSSEYSSDIESVATDEEDNDPKDFSGNEISHKVSEGSTRNSIGRNKSRSSLRYTKNPSLLGVTDVNSVNSKEHRLLDNAFANIENTQDESHPSGIFGWFNQIPNKISLGRSIRNNEAPEEYDMTDFRGRIGNDIESNAGRSTASKFPSLPNGKTLNEILKKRSNFDEILSPSRKFRIKGFQKGEREEPRSDTKGDNRNAGTEGRGEEEEESDGDTKHEFDDGITWNLMRLYNEIPDSVDEDNIFSDDSSIYLNERMGKKPYQIGGGIQDRVRRFRHSNMFSGSSRENSLDRGRSMFRSQSRSGSKSPLRPKSLNRFYKSEDDLYTNQIKLPDFSLGKEKEDKRLKKIKKKSKRYKAARITVHIVELIYRQEFLLTLCKAFMMYGAPNHRLEEYLTVTAKVLEVNATFIYLPGMMLVNFSDPTTRTSDLKLVRVGQGLNLGKLDKAHDIYESVVYDRLGVDEASKALDDLFTSTEFLNNYWLILFYGLSSMFVLCFFNGAWLDMIPSFLLGCLLGFLQCIVAPKNEIYTSFFEVGVAIVISFVSRAIGSIANGKYFCFSAIVLSSLSNILPGYMILRGALEIQSKSIISGVVGLIYAIIYSLFLGFGLTLGSALYGWIDKNAYDKTTCSNIGHIGDIWKLLMVPLFNITVALVSQGKIHQLPVMCLVGCGGYVVTYFASKHFTVTQISSALGAFTVGVLSNVYDRWGKHLTKFTGAHCSTKFTAMICGIFDLVPGGFAARNVLSTGLQQLGNGGSSNTSVASTSTSTTAADTSTYLFGVTMVEIAIGITVGLFMATLAVYPLGPKRGESSIGL